MALIATLGPSGSFTSALAQTVASSDDKIVYTTALKGLQSVRKKEVSIAVFPFENNVGGFVTESIAALYKTSGVNIVRMPKVAIVQNLIGHAGCLEQIDTIYSHPQAFAQCSRKIEAIERKIGKTFNKIKVASTSEGVRLCASDPSAAAIGSQAAAEAYRVPIIRAHFQDKARNETRFMVLKRGMAPYREGAEYRSMYLFEFESLHQGLASLTGMLCALDVRICSLVQTPVYRMQGDAHYAFFVEVEGHRHDGKLDAVHRAVTGRRLLGQSRKARWVGSYKNEQPCVL